MQTTVFMLTMASISILFPLYIIYIIHIQSCINIANEPPQDIKANMARAWGSFDQTRLDGAARPVVFKAMLYGLCFFHSGA